MPLHRPFVRVVTGVSVLSLLLVACSGSGGSDDEASATTTPVASTAPPTTAPPPTVPATTEPAPTTVPPTTAPSASTPREILDAVGPSVAYLSNDLGSGTGWAIDGGYLVTSAHVVVPFSTVDVTPPAGDTIEDVPVVGVDFTADIAVIGPLDEALPALDLDAPPAVEGDQVFLIGYPSETDPSPTPTISQGIVSRVRDIVEFDQTYVQTDAAIAGGQSGGALVDAFGRVVGISGMSLDEAFALALSVADLGDRLDAMLDGGDPWQPYPDEGVTTGTITVPGIDVGAVLVSVAPETDTDVTFSVEGVDDLGFEVYLDDGGYVTTQSVITAAAESFEIPQEELLAQIEGEVIEPGADGAYTFSVPAGIRATIWVGRLAEDVPAEVTFTSSLALAPIADLDDDAVVTVGKTVDAVIEPLEWQDVYVLELTAGQTVTITAASPTGDMAFDLLVPGERVSATSIYIDDSSIGLGGLDSQLEFTAEVDGPHRIIVSELTGSAGYQLTVE